MIKNDIEIDLVSRWNLCDGKMFDFVSFPLFGFTLVIKLGLSSFRNHRNTLKISDEKNMVSDLNMSHGKMSDFDSFPFFRFTLVMKLRDFNFESQ